MNYPKTLMDADALLRRAIVLRFRIGADAELRPQRDELDRMIGDLARTVRAGLDDLLRQIAEDGGRT
jgi:hypothetical protein